MSPGRRRKRATERRAQRAANPPPTRTPSNEHATAPRYRRAQREGERRMQ